MSVAARWLVPALWALFVVSAAWFLIGDLIFVAGRDPAEQAVRWFGYVGHVLSALPVLVIAPLQFSGALRRAKPAVHRWLGRIFLGGAMLAGAFAVWLGATMPIAGTQVPLMLFGLVWMGLAAIAWQAARRRDYVTHRAFVVRVFVLSTSFLWLHVLQEGEDTLFWFLESPELRHATRGWLSLVGPLIAAEIWVGWGPAARLVFRLRITGTIEDLQAGDSGFHKEAPNPQSQQEADEDQ